jgi:hypothetical protein
MKKLLRIVLLAMDYSSMFVAFLALICLCGLAAFAAVREVGKEVSGIWRNDRSTAYIVVISAIWCFVRWKALTKPGPHEPIIESVRGKRLSRAAIPGSVGVVMAGCVVFLVVSLVRDGFKHADSEMIVGALFCGLTSAISLIDAFRTLRGDG